jgi:hypothetical protein
MPTLTPQDKKEIRAKIKQAKQYLKDNDIFSVGFVNGLNQAISLYLQKLGLTS